MPLPVANLEGVEECRRRDSSGNSVMLVVNVRTNDMFIAITPFIQMTMLYWAYPWGIAERPLLRRATMCDLLCLRQIHDTLHVLPVRLSVRHGLLTFHFKRAKDVKSLPKVSTRMCVYLRLAGRVLTGGMYTGWSKKTGPLYIFPNI